MRFGGDRSAFSRDPSGSPGGLLATGTSPMRTSLVLLSACVAAARLSRAAPVAAQDLFEIQVYPYDIVEPGQTMLEFHTNFIPSGTKTTDDGTYANDRQVHETLEITHGFTSFFEVGFYIETAPYVPGVAQSSPGGTSGRGFACRVGRSFRLRRVEPHAPFRQERAGHRRWQLAGQNVRRIMGMRAPDKLRKYSATAGNFSRR